MENLLHFNSVSHSFGSGLALDEVTFSVPKGSITALLGQNGAGKSTTLKIAMNLLSPTKGDATILGVSSKKLAPAQLRHIGYVADGMDLPLWMTVKEFLAWCRPLYPSWDIAFEGMLTEQFELPQHRRLSELSRGQRMKAALLSSLAYRPELIILDEPFSGLDPVVRDEFISGLLEMADQEAWSLLISSHDIEEVQKLADRVVILNNGRVLVEETLDELLARHRLVEVAVPEDFQMAKMPPKHWQGAKRSGRILRFVHTQFLEETLAKELSPHLPGPPNHSVSEISLRDIFVSLVKAGK